MTIGFVVNGAGHPRRRFVSNVPGPVVCVTALVAPAGFEPAISALRGLRPRPLDDGAVPATGAGLGSTMLANRG